MSALSVHWGSNQEGSSCGCSGCKGHTCPSRTNSDSWPWGALLDDCLPGMPLKALQPRLSSGVKHQAAESAVCSQGARRRLGEVVERLAELRMWQVSLHTQGHTDETAAPCQGQGYPVDIAAAVREMQPRMPTSHSPQPRTSACLSCRHGPSPGSLCAVTFRKQHGPSGPCLSQAREQRVHLWSVMLCTRLSPPPPSPLVSASSSSVPMFSALVLGGFIGCLVPPGDEIPIGQQQQEVRLCPSVCHMGWG